MTSLPLRPLRFSDPRTDETPFSLSGHLRQRLQPLDWDSSSPPSPTDSTATQPSETAPSEGGLSPPEWVDTFPLGLSEYVVHDDTLAVQGSPNSLYTPVGPDSPSEEYNLDSAMGDSTSTSAFGSGELGHLGLATGRVKRVTMFKIPDLANQQLLVDAYKVLEEKQSKDANGKSYILSLDAGIVEDPARAQGHTVIGTTEFNSLEDMRFYDEECQDHTALKARARELGLEEPPLVAYWMVRVDPGEEVAV